MNNQLIITSTFQRLFRFPSLSAIAVILKDCLFVYSVTYCECYEPQQRLDSEQTAVSHKSSTHLSTSILETLLVRTKCMTSCTVCKSKFVPHYWTISPLQHCLVVLRCIFEMLLQCEERLPMKPCLLSWGLGRCPLQPLGQLKQCCLQLSGP